PNQKSANAGTAGKSGWPGCRTPLRWPEFASCPWKEEIRAAAPQREVGKRPLKGKRPRHQGQTLHLECVPSGDDSQSPPVYRRVRRYKIHRSPEALLNDG